MTPWALKPYTSVTNPSEVFNLSSPNAVLNVLSVIYFLMLTIFRKNIPQEKLPSFIVYSFAFLVFLSFFLDNEVEAPPDNVLDFSERKRESDILSVI